MLVKINKANAEANLVMQTQKAKSQPEVNHRFINPRYLGFINLWVNYSVNQSG